MRNESSSSPLILAVNSGSSSLKFGLFTERDGDEVALFQGGADAIGRPNSRLTLLGQDGAILADEATACATQKDALQAVIAALNQHGVPAPAAIGHRVVHGGPHLREHQRITPALLQTLESAIHFAPLHIPVELALIRETERLLPGAPQFACFDTAFHATMPESSARFSLPDALYQKGVLRFGFHGLSYESVVHRLGPNCPPRVVCAHLGSGASLVAMRNGRSIDTSMGLTPTGGIPMATRSGDIDPGVLIFLMRNESLDADALETLLNRNAGLTALSGGESDMRRLQSAMESGDQRAALAIRVFAGAVRKYIAAYAAELGGLDLLVFTGGIGEHSQFVRDMICENLGFMGITAANIKVMPSQEEPQIARQCRRLMRKENR